MSVSSLYGTRLTLLPLTPDEIKTLKAKMLKLPTMPMEIFKKVLGNIDEKYPFSLSPKLILALLIYVL